jgi:hypothetical protein
VNRCRLVLLGALPLVVSLGCFQDPNSMLVPSNPFGNPPAVTSQALLANQNPATQETASKVLLLTEKLIAANPQLGVHPLPATVGSPTPELFHVGTARIVITEGLVKQCQDEGQLAALLSLELGKMVSDREAQAGLATRNPNREPPAGPGVGLEGGGSHGAADMTQLAEAAPYDQIRKRQMHPPPPPDSKLLAKLILEKAGYGDSELTAIEPLLKTAAENSGLEKQMTQTKSNAASWIR